MEKCVHINTARASFLQHTHPQFTCINNPSLITTTTSKPSTASFFNRRRTTSRLVCKSSFSEVEVVTACSWNQLVVAADTTVVVEFWAPWCGPCQMIAPVVDELAKEYKGKALCYKLNTDDCPTIASEYGIRSIPTVLFFKGGEKKESVLGAVPKSALSAILDKYVD